MLTLNFLAPDHPTPADFYQFALSPEDEARAVARRVVQEGRLRGVALIPSGDWGVRVLAAFSEQLQKSGGQLLSSATLPAGRNDFQNAIQQVLRISDSRARHERLERVLGTSLEFQPRRRTDVDFIFAPGQAPIARQLKPQLKFYYAGDIPTYATSDAYEPSSTLNQDMEGLIFPDMPWMVSGSAAVTKLHGAVHDAWGDDTGGRGGRLFGFGYDAWSLAIALQSNRGSGAGWPLNGVTGELSLDEQHRVRREFDWAQIRSGSPRVLSRASDK